MPGSFLAALPFADDVSRFMPHGHCFLWTPSLLWTYVIADGTIAFAYFSIPWWLLSFARRRPDMPLQRLLLMFGAFITACGLTHLIEVWDIWHAAYWLDAGVKAVTAAVSLLTAVTLWRIMPLALSLPSPGQLQEANRSLERRVDERTRELQQANRALEEQGTRLQAVIEMAMDAIITVDAQQHILVFNRAAESMFGYLAAEVNGTPLSSLIPQSVLAGHPSPLPGLDSATRHHAGAGERDTLIGLRRNGEQFPIEASISRTEVQGSVFYTVIVRDISGRVAAEASLRRLADIVASSGDAIISESLDGIITSWNDAAADLLGWRAEEMIGASIQRVIPPEFAAIARASRAQLREGVAVKPFDTHRIRRDGTSVPVSVTLSAIHDPEGRVTGISAITRDMTEKRQLEEQLAATLALQTAILESAALGIIATDTQGTIVRFNPAAERMLGYRAGELVGMARSTLFHLPEELASRARELQLPPEPAGSHEVLVLAARGGQAEEREWTFRRKDGTLFPVLLALTPLNDEHGRLTGFLGIVSDITERKRIENHLKSALRAQETLLKEVYHRVKNNLQVVTSLFNLQLRNLPPGVARECLEDGASRVRSMALVHEMLYQSHDLSSINLERYIADLCGQLSMAHEAGERGIRFVTAVEGVTVPLDVAVPLGLSLNELVSNSLKHGFPDGRRGEIRITLARTGEGRVRLEVWDNGVGWARRDSPVAQRSLGLQLVASLSRQIDAELLMEARDGAYTRLEFRADPPNPATHEH